MMVSATEPTRLGRSIQRSFDGSCGIARPTRKECVINESGWLVGLDWSRFQLRLYCPLPDASARRAIIQRSLEWWSESDLDELVALSDKWSGSDLATALAGAKQAVLREAIEQGRLSTTGAQGAAQGSQSLRALTTVRNQPSSARRQAPQTIS